MIGDEPEAAPTEPIAHHIRAPERVPSPEAAMLERTLETALRANALFDLEVVPVTFPQTTRRGNLYGSISEKPATTKLALLSLPIAIDESPIAYAVGPSAIENTPSACAEAPPAKAWRPNATAS